MRFGSKGAAGASATRFAVGLVVVLGGACGNDDHSADSKREDTAKDTERDTAEEVRDDGAAEVAPEVDANDTNQVEEVTATKGFGERCSTNPECLSGYCVPTAAGNACTRPCGAQCPEGWSCGKVLNAGVDGIEVCLDRQTTLCHPCREDDDCNLFSGLDDNVCLDFGARGSFCGIPCSASRVCPTGYECTDDDGVLTAGSGQCRPAAGGECTCNPLAVTLARSTICTESNDVGTCSGERGCGDEGLGACDARVPSAELCNNIDDDCNGGTDDSLAVGGECLVENNFGECPGRAFCVAGEEQCIGLPAQAEICDNQDQDCDGQTDEGFPNLDGDLEPDCLDDDDDGDGAADGEDCAPKDKTRYQGATEKCNGEDDDCNGQKDDEGAEGCVVYFQDVDRDGFGSLAAPSRCLCASDPTTFYDKLTQSDCNDLDDAVFPGATEVCNGYDDSCGSGIDEGVQAPCGGCRNACLLEAGDGGSEAFAGGRATNLTIDGSGHLVLSNGQTSGTYRQIWTGWPLDQTTWRILFVAVDYPDGANGGGTSISLRWRTAANEAGLTGAAFSTSVGPFPPQYLPVWPDVDGHVIEVELSVTTTTAGVSPTIRSIGVLGAVAESP